MELYLKLFIDPSYLIWYCLLTFLLGSKTHPICEPPGIVYWTVFNKFYSGVISWQPATAKNFEHLKFLWKMS